VVLHTNTKLTKKPQKFGEICAINAFTIHQVQASIKVLSVHALARHLLDSMSNCIWPKVPLFMGFPTPPLNPPTQCGIGRDQDDQLLSGTGFTLDFKNVISSLSLTMTENTP